MAEPTLLFCIGATKAGTSWLHRYISDHPACHMRAIKELHYFDAVAFDDFDPWIKAVTTQRGNHIARAEAGTPPVRERQLKMVADAEAWLQVLQRRKRDDAAYLGYLDEGLTTETVVGDMTPGYALLPEEWLAEMAAIRPNVRFVYILRDPVARLWSHCRMIAQRRSKTPLEYPERSIHILKRAFVGKEREIVKRSDYKGPLSRMRAVLKPEQLYIGFYEELFTDAAMADLCGFLGIPPAPADFGKRILKGPEADMAPGQYDQAREFLAEEYAYAEATFDRLPAAWGTEMKAAV